MVNRTPSPLKYMPWPSLVLLDPGVDSLIQMDLLKCVIIQINFSMTLFIDFIEDRERSKQFQEKTTQ